MSNAGHTCPANENMADYLLDVTTIDKRSENLRKKSTSVVDNIQHYYTSSEQHKVTTIL